MLSYLRCFHRAIRLLIFLLLVGVPLGVFAQQQAPAPPSTQKPQTAPPEAGGPTGDTGPMALPKKGEAPPEAKPQKPSKIEGMPEYSIKVDTSLVQVPVLVTTKDGQFIPGLKQGNFKVFEDGVEQKVQRMDISEAPITAVLLVEFSNKNYMFMDDALRASYAFADSLKKNDWVAVIEFDMKPMILTDFTQDKRSVFEALNSLRIPGFSETNIFDALYDTLDRVASIEGRKYVMLISSGCDTFSKITYDKVMKKIKDTPDVTIFTLSTGEVLRMWAEAQGYGQGMGGLMPCTSQMDYLQADNQMNTFAKMTGGRWYKPRFEAEMPEIFRDIASNIRNQYVLSYHPTNPKLDGSYRKLKVELQAPDGGPLKVKDQKGKDLKYQIIAREGYTAKHEVE
jgi:VWFA-related protein